MNTNNATQTLVATCPSCAESLTAEVLIGTTSVECFACGEHLNVDLRIDPVTSKRMYRNEDWLSTEYTVNERSMADIARQCGVSPMTIHIWLGKHGIETRRRGGRKSE